MGMVSLSSLVLFGSEKPSMNGLVVQTQLGRPDRYSDSTHYQVPRNVPMAFCEEFSAEFRVLCSVSYLRMDS